MIVRIMVKRCAHHYAQSMLTHAAPTFTSPFQSVREDGGLTSVCITGGISNETVAIQTENSLSANS